MSKACYTVVDGKAREIKKKYVVVDGVTREIAKKYIVVDGVTRLCYQNVINISSAVVTLASGTLTYNGSAQTKGIASVVVEGKTLVAGTDYTVTGNSATNAGTHTMTITGIGDYEGTITKTWTIAKLSLTKPTVSGSFTYNGSARSCTVSGMNSTYITQSGTTSATNAGTYTVTFTLKSTTNTQWSDGTTAAVSRTWKIAQAAGSISVNPSTLDILGPAGTTGTATITYTGDGSISVASSATGVATVSRSSKKITVKSVAAGSTTITITLAAGTNYTGASCTIEATVQVFSVTLEENTWPQIAEASAAGIASSLWNVGDTKTETLNGTSYTFRIAGFDHDALDSTDAKYGDSNYNGGTNKAGITFEMVELFATGYYMYSSTSNSNGWGSSYMRSTVMGKMKGYMPTALQNVLRTVSKLTSAGKKSSTIKTTADELFLYSEIEIKGTVNKTFAGEGSQYDYYKAGNSAIKKRGSTVNYWWLRSPASANSTSYAIIDALGSASANLANNSETGVTFGFCL